MGATGLAWPEYPKRFGAPSRPESKKQPLAGKTSAHRWVARHGFNLARIGAASEAPVTQRTRTDATGFD
jgi:hypothetical protein